MLGTIVAVGVLVAPIAMMAWLLRTSFKDEDRQHLAPGQAEPGEAIDPRPEQDREYDREHNHGDEHTAIPAASEAQRRPDQAERGACHHAHLGQRSRQYRRNGTPLMSITYPDRGIAS